MEETAAGEAMSPRTARRLLLVGVVAVTIILCWFH